VTVGVGSQLGSSGAGVGSDKGNAQSTSRAGISGVAGNTEARTGDAETGIKPIFDKNRVSEEVNAQITITREFGRQATRAGAQYAQDQLDKARGLRNIAALEEDPDKRQSLLTQAQQIENDWKEGGSSRVLMHAGIGLLTSGSVGGAAGAAGSAAATPQLAEMLNNPEIPQPIREGILMAAGTAIGAAVGGVDGAATGNNEVANNGLGTVVRRLGLGGVALCLRTVACLALTGATGLELTRLANLARQENPAISDDGAYAIAVADYLGDRVQGKPIASPLGPNNTGGNQTENPIPGGNSTTTPNEGPRGGNDTGGNQIVDRKPGDNSTTTPAATPPNSNLVFATGVPPSNQEDKEDRGRKYGVDISSPTDKYSSNSKHTLGGDGNRGNASIEPPYAGRLFESSVKDPNSNERFAIDSDGGVHRYFYGNDGSYHWSGSTTDPKQPLESFRIPKEIRRFYGLPGKGW
ncbi:hypothetical protein SAMN05192589_1371, partial [Paracidovorax valerianellae]